MNSTTWGYADGAVWDFARGIVWDCAPTPGASWDR